MSTNKSPIDLESIVDGTITGVARTEKDELGDVYLGLIVNIAKNENIVVWFLRDDEGNGPGSFDLQKA